MCATFNVYGKNTCPSRQIPEEILEKTAAEVLKIRKFNKYIFEQKIKQIIVPSAGKLEFILNDGSKIMQTWDYASRSESWTSEMRQSAREKKINQIKRSKNCESSLKI